jgi:hypothetical protein
MKDYNLHNLVIIRGMQVEAGVLLNDDLPMYWAEWEGGSRGLDVSVCPQEGRIMPSEGAYRKYQLQKRGIFTLKGW